MCTFVLMDGKGLAICYVRVSTADQVKDGASLAAQTSLVTNAAIAEGYQIEVIREEGKSAASIKGRPQLLSALERLSRGEASALYVQRVDRLSRSVSDFAALLTLAHRQGWSITALDVGLDTSSPSGEFMANIVASVSQYERKIIGARTRDALAQRRLEGKRLGKPTQILPSVLQQIDQLRQDGKSYQAIADRLNREEVPTVNGGIKWYSSTIHRAINRQVIL
jgi:DNA invertase Pin-like site-specific DNA recombinase